MGLKNLGFHLILETSDTDKVTSLSKRLPTYFEREMLRELKCELNWVGKKRMSADLSLLP
jgi:hypothetical protein